MTNMFCNGTSSWSSSSPEIESETLDTHHTCGKGHRSSVLLRTRAGGSICLVCFSLLLSSPSSPTVHVSYAISQLSLAARDPDLLLRLRTCHARLLVAPLVRALSGPDEAIPVQAIDLVSDLCGLGSGSGSGSESGVSADFVARISDQLSAPGGIGWSQRHLYSLHCFGILLDSYQDDSPSSHIRDSTALFSNLIDGLQLPSEELRGEILFILYKLSVLGASLWDDVGDNLDDANSCYAKMILRVVHLSLEALLKSQQDDVRMNYLALLLVLAQRGFFENLFATGQSGSSSRKTDDWTQTDGTMLQTPFINLFAEAVKGPLLSSDAQVQVRTLDLIFHALSSEFNCAQHIRTLVEESIADYVFEILRLSGNKDSLVISCLQVLVLLDTAEEAFRERLAIGFPTILCVLHHVAEIPFHPVQSPVLKLVWSCISQCPGVVSMSQVEDLALILTGILRRHTTGEMGMLSETFILSCSTFVEILKSPSATGMQKVVALVQEATRNMVLSSLSVPEDTPNLLILYSLYLLKESHVYSLHINSNTNPGNVELEKSIIGTCETYLLPWLARSIDEGQEEEVILDVLETFHLILLRGSEVETKKFAETLASSSWFSLSFGCLGLFPSDQIKSRVYLILSSVLDKSFGLDFGQPIRDSYMHLLSDPLELLYLMGQRSSGDPDLTSCQRAVLLMLYVSSLYGDSFADNTQVLASLEQYVLVNGSNFFCGIAESIILTQLVNLYGLIRGTLIVPWTKYSVEAERALYTLIADSEWDLLSTGTHPVALKWLFQQEGIMAPLSNQILNFARFFGTNKSQISVHSTMVQVMDIRIIAELVVSGDNCVALLLLSLLEKLHEEGNEDDTTYVVNVMAAILNLYPEASNQFCLHGIDHALHVILYSIGSGELFISCSLLVFRVLYSANHQAIPQDGKWLAVTVKLLDFVKCKLAPQSFGQEGDLVFGIFCLILQHSTNQVLQAASKAILLNNSLIQAIDSIIQAACTKGPALADYDEETSVGKCLIYVLLLYSFSLKSSHAILQEDLNWQDFFRSSREVQSSSIVICIKCHDLCRLMHFGSRLVRLVASECLVELLTRISDQRIIKQDGISCSMGYLESMMSVIEGLVFYGDSRVSTNCGLSLSMMLGWEKLGFLEKRVVGDSKWCRLLLEELTITLAAPRLASNCFSNQHKPATCIAVAMLRPDEAPGWIRSVFTISCISGLIDSLSASNLTPEIVMLFRELMSRKYINKEQVARLHHLFQVCRKQVYADTSKEKLINQSLEKVVAIPDDLGKLYNSLIHLMVCPLTDTNNRLLEEIDIFFQESSTY